MTNRGTRPARECFGALLDMAVGSRRVSGSCDDISPLLTLTWDQHHLAHYPSSATPVASVHFAQLLALPPLLTTCPTTAATGSTASRPGEVPQLGSSLEHGVSLMHLIKRKVTLLRLAKKNAVEKITCKYS